MTAAVRSPLRLRDFRLLWIGEAISSLGDQFAMVALPWLALLLTGSAFALGTVLAVMAIPRAILMAVGGAYVDRLSPRRVILTSNAVRLVAVSALAGIVLAGQVQLWMLYAFALVFGVADAFFYPAQTSIVPELVDGAQLPQANGIVQGTAQLSVLVGPAIAGVAIVALGAGTGPVSGTGQVGLTGVGLALLVDAVTFVASLVSLLLIRPRPAQATTGESVVSQIAEGIRFVWRMPALRTVMLLSMGANLLIFGPFEVGLPVLAYTRLPEGAAGFGLIISAFGGGSLLGLAAASILPAVSAARFGTFILVLTAVTGLGLAALAFAQSTLAALAIAVVIGTILGYTNISFMTWIQRRIPRELMGRVMGLLMFSSFALAPVSMALAGVLVQVSLDGLFLVSGIGMAVLTLIALASGSVRRMGLEPVIQQDDAPATGLAEGTAPALS